MGQPRRSHHLFTPPPAPGAPINSCDPFMIVELPMRLREFAPELLRYINPERLSGDLRIRLRRAFDNVKNRPDRLDVMAALYWSPDLQAEHKLQQQRVAAEIEKTKAETRKLRSEAERVRSIASALLDDDLVESSCPALPGMRTFRVGVLLDHGRHVEVRIDAKDRDEARIKAEALYGKGRVRHISDTF